ncbi:PGPGW domain-containing protein [Alteromonas sp. CYL-A6]|uniref:PGPGW domain-containing protein n=1 Tax=Alteromonas nitratireducens TaxID=3390813 RepID=UPI0034AA9CF6
MKTLRLTAGLLCVAVGIIFTILPGSILLVIAGLVMLSVDFPAARKYLRHAQRGMSHGARRLDRYLLNRKLR